MKPAPLASALNTGIYQTIVAMTDFGWFSTSACACVLNTALTGKHQALRASRASLKHLVAWRLGCYH